MCNIHEQEQQESEQTRKEKREKERKKKKRNRKKWLVPISVSAFPSPLGLHARLDHNRDLILFVYVCFSELLTTN